MSEAMNPQYAKTSRLAMRIAEHFEMMAGDHPEDYDIGGVIHMIRRGDIDALLFPERVLVSELARTFIEAAAHEADGEAQVAARLAASSNGTEACRKAWLADVAAYEACAAELRRLAGEPA